MRRSRGRRRPSPPGGRVAPADRARLLRRLAALVEEHGEELARIESRNVGKPIAGARGEVGMVAQVFHFYAGAVDKHYGETIPVAGGEAFTFREPLGVVGLIVPWNFPRQHRLLEARACARDREHGRAEAGRADAALGAAARRARARGRDPGGRRQRRRRQGLGRRRAPRRASGRGQDRLHRLDRGRTAGDERCGRHDQARHARARRQVGQRRLRRRRPRAGRGLGAVRRLRQRRPGLLRALADLRRAERLRPLRGAARRRRRERCRSAIPRTRRPRWGR